MATSRKYDLYSSDFRETTHETYARMRREDPVLNQPGIDGETPIWFVTRYDDVVAVLLDDEHFVVDPALALDPEEYAQRQADIMGDERVAESLLTRDGEDHRRLRRLVSKAFTPRIVEQLRPRAEQIANELLDATEGRTSMDLTVAPASRAASAHGVTLASWSSRLTMISSPAFQVRPNARLRASVSVVMFGPKAISSGSGVPSRSASALRARSRMSSVSRLVANGAPLLALCCAR